MTHDQTHQSRRLSMPRLRGFLGLRIRRVFAYSILSGVLMVFYGLGEIEPELAVGWAQTLESESFLDFLHNLKWFALFDLLPVLVISTLLLVLGLFAGGIAGIVLTTLVPRRAFALVDGVFLGIATLPVFEITGLNNLLDNLPYRGVTNLGVFWVFILSLSDLLWKHLPYGFSLTEKKQRDIDMPIDVVRPRLIPELAPDLTLADTAWRQGSGLPTQNCVPLDVKHIGLDTYQMTESPGQPGADYRVTTYRLTEPVPGRTGLEVTVNLMSLSPLALWMAWARPYGEDYVTHIVARLSGAKDRSIYGAYFRRIENRQTKRAQRGQLV